MARPGNNVHIPLSTDKAIGLLLRVKPNDSMPRPGAHPTKSKMAKLDEEFGALQLGAKPNKKAKQV
jgi:hypothetical protein